MSLEEIKRYIGLEVKVVLSSGQSQTGVLTIHENKKEILLNRVWACLIEEIDMIIFLKS